MFLPHVSRLQGPSVSPALVPKDAAQQQHRRRSCPQKPQRFHSIRSEWWTVRAVCVVPGSCGPRAVPGKGCVLWALGPEGLGSSFTPALLAHIPAPGTSPEMGKISFPRLATVVRLLVCLVWKSRVPPPLPSLPGGASPWPWTESGSRTQKSHLAGLPKRSKLGRFLDGKSVCGSLGFVVFNS